MPLHKDATSEARGQLWLLLGVVGFAPAIACANVANLTLARTATRRRETSVRLAIGASRRRVAQQFLVETLLLGSAGGAAGLALALAAIRAAVPDLPADLPADVEHRFGLARARSSLPRRRWRRACSSV